jgi:membrane protein YdbS with pleckstrin-like domain
MNRAPKLFTILIAVVLVIAGALGTFAHLYDDHVGAWLYVAASFVMVLGIIFRGI